MSAVASAWAQRSSPLDLYLMRSFRASVLANQSNGRRRPSFLLRVISREVKVGEEQERNEAFDSFKSCFDAVRRTHSSQRSHTTTF